ncbi:MAG: translation elongation factor 4, partial [Dehalococcoidia bacterium]|nr:translation elongation factor 4 [Dehalococcoidia bacterium]
QGIQAQTLANIYLALEQGIHIIPVVNKIDSNLANPEAVSLEIQNTFGFKEEEILFVSAKTGEGVEALLEAVVKDIPSPKGETSESLQALIFDSKYDSFKGVLAYVRVKNGIIKVGEKLHLMGTGKDCEVLETGTFNPNLMKKDFLNTGEVGYIATGLKNVRDCRVGDTLTTTLNPAGNSLSGYESLKSMVFSGLYPVDGEQYPNLRDSLGKLQLNDASLVFEPETSGALGFGFRCGFLGLLHMDIVQERLEREYNIELIGTAPTVKYTVELDNKSSIEVDNPSKWPEKQKINQVFEPWIRLSTISPSEYIGPITELVTSHRGEFINTEWIQSNSVGSQLSGSRVLMEFNIPLSEILVDFHGKLKSCSKGYASMDYSQISPRPSDLVKLQILINEQKVDSLSVITHRSRSVYMARDLVKQLKELIPRQMFDIPLQGGIGGKIIARETIKALRKNVTAKCYGGDITRKRKLLAKQAEGKKRMKKVGSVEVPQEAFMSILRSDHQE